MTDSFLNIAAYRFAELAEDTLPDLRQELRELGHELNLRGTILLSPEGINLFLAGEPAGVRALLDRLHAVPGLADLTTKESWSAEQPFNRYLVKIKREIIAFGVAGIDPVHAPAPRLAPAELKRWLDEGRPVTLLDTRNDYEVRLGTFRGAVPVGVDHFRDFPAAAKQLPSELHEHPVVTFCTGGIRCEKAAPLLQQLGFRQVFQLDGGILRYFEECGGEHYDGECFVFDRRVGLDAELRETGAALCFNCQMPLTATDQTDPRYVPDVSCPFCHPIADGPPGQTGK